MKKFKYLIILFCVVLVAGCGNKKDPKVMLEDAFRNMRNIENTGMKMTGVVGFNAEGMALNMDVNMDMKVDTNQNVYGLVKMSFFGQEQQQEVYLIHKGDEQYSYTNDGEKWIYNVESYTEAIKELTDEEYETELKKFLDIIIEVKEEKTDKEGYTKLVVTIDHTKISDLLSSYGDVVDDETYAIDLNNDLVFTLYLKDGYISIVEIDMSDMINDLIKQESVEIDETMSQMDMTVKMSFEYYDINKIEAIELPKEVEESAILESEYENTEEESVTEEV